MATATALAATGCAAGSDDDAASTSTRPAGCAAESTVGSDGVNLIPIPPAKVTVTDPGEGEQRVPAAAPNRTTPQVATLVTTSSTASPGTTESQTVEIPVTALFHCADSTDLEMTLDTPTSPDLLLSEQLAAAEGTRAGLAVGPGIAPISLRILPTDESGPQARLALEQALISAFSKAITLPTEPVGVGATWRTERVISAAATLTQTIEVRLAGWNDDSVSLEFTIDETPVNSVFALPGGSQTLTIERYTFSGSGTAEMSLSRALPLTADLEMTGARELVGADPAQPLLQQLGYTMTWRSR